MSATKQQPMKPEDRMQLATHRPEAASALVEAQRKRRAPPDMPPENLVTVHIHGRPELGPLEWLPGKSASDITNALSEELGVSVGGWLRIGNRFLMGRDRIPAGEYVFRPKGAPPGGPGSLLTRGDLAEQLAAHSEGLARQLAEVRKRIVASAPSDDEDMAAYEGARLSETRVWEHVPMEPQTPLPKGIGHAKIGDYVDCAVEFAREGN